jgi:Tol biopolymer transport system component
MSMKFLLLIIGLNLLSALLVAGAIGYGMAYPGGEILFDLRSEAGFVVQQMDVRTHIMRVLPVQSPSRNLAQWSPDGMQLAYVVKETDGDSIYVTDLTARVPQVMVDGVIDGSITGFAWSPDSRRIAVTSASVWIIEILGDSPPVSFDPDSGDFNYHGVTWSPDGTRVAVTHFSSQFELYFLDISTGKAHMLAHCDDPDWSPSGSGITCVNNFQVRTVDVDSGVVTRIGEGFEPAWSPDGEWIAFSRGIAPRVDLMLYNVDSGEVSTLLSNGTVNLMSDWHPLR